MSKFASYPMVLWAISLLLSACSSSALDHQEETTSAQKPAKSWALVIHGGAGNISKNISEEKRKAHEEGLEEALTIGKNILEKGGSSMEAVEQVIRYLEDHPEFNAGRGAVLTADKTHELDAAIMDGSNLKTGAVTGVSTVRHPITLAKLVMEKSPHVFFWGSGAEKFADEMGVERVENSFFTTEERAKKMSMNSMADPELSQSFSLGTVGAVAIDKQGNIVAGTSTGGRSGKAHGRIGDSPIIGAGTYANNQTCGISATGAGEEFIRRTVAYDISALMEYKNLSLEEAASQVIHEKLKPGDGGVIGIDRNGNIIQTYNTKGMYRGKADSEGLFEIAIWE